MTNRHRDRQPDPWRSGPRVVAAPVLAPHACAVSPVGTTSDRLFAKYATLLGWLLVGYMLFDKAFAYIHIPGTPAYVGEIVLSVGALAALTAVGHVQTPDRHSEMIFCVLAVFCAWGLILLMSDVSTYGVDAVRDSALWYYALFAFFTYSAFARTPDLLERWTRRLARLTPWLLVWPTLDLVLGQKLPAPSIPGTGVSILTMKTGDPAITALLVLGYLWLIPGKRSARSRGAWSIVAVGVVAVVGTQNRGALLATILGAAVGLVYYKDRARLIKQAAVVGVLGLGVAFLLPAIPGAQERDFSPSQLIENVASVWDSDSDGNLNGTTQWRQDLWTRILQRQIADGHLVDGQGFGLNLARQVEVYDAGTDNLRNPHNSHLDILARMGLIGFFLWIALWLGWYWRLIESCRRLQRQGMELRRQVAVVCMMVATSILTSTYFDPQLEGPQVAVILWSVFGLGVAVTSVRIPFKVSRSKPEQARLDL